MHFGTKIVWGEEFAPDHALLQLLEAAIDAWEDTDSALHARLLARLGFALRFTTERERRLYVSRRGVEMARRLDDPRIIAETLHSWLAAHWRPDNLTERVALSAEMAHRAEQAHDLELAVAGHAWRCITLLELGDWPAVRLARTMHERLLERLRDPLHRWFHQGARFATAIQEGRFAEAESLAQECLSLEQTVNNGPPFGFLAQTFSLWCAQGRRDALEAVWSTRNASAVHLPHVAHQCGMAYMASALGYTAEAGAEFTELAKHQFADVPHDEAWFLCMHQLADVCAFLGDVTRAELLIQLLTPYETRLMLSPASKVYLGPVSHSLAVLETILSSWNDAGRHFEHAVQASQLVASKPCLARTQCEYARMLLARGEAATRHARTRSSRQRWRLRASSRCRC